MLLSRFEARNEVLHHLYIWSVLHLSFLISKMADTPRNRRRALCILSLLFTYLMFTLISTWKTFGRYKWIILIFSYFKWFLFCYLEPVDLLHSQFSHWLRHASRNSLSIPSSGIALFSGGGKKQVCILYLMEIVCIKHSNIGNW